MGLELFVGLIQAFILSMLTLVFAATATVSHAAEDHYPTHPGDPEPTHRNSPQKRASRLSIPPWDAGRVRLPGS